MLMKLLRLLPGRRRTGAEGETNASTGDGKTADTERRFREIYGEEKLGQQLLYERWVVKDTWHLRNEALPLLHGINPDAYQAGSEGNPGETAINELWVHARHCIDQGLLPVANREQRPEDWRVEPLHIYQWALVSRMQLPEPFIALMEFIGRTVKRSPPAVVVPGDIPDGGEISAAFDGEREKVLGLALAVMSACPDRCRNEGGEITAEQILDACKALAGQHWQSLRLADGAIIDLIDKWLKTSLPNAHH